MPVVIQTVAGMRQAVRSLRAQGQRIALTPTLGALHDGHLAHVRRAAELADIRVVSIFVNPTQFGPNEDLAKYPRTLDADLAALDAEGVDLVFAPSADEMYPTGPTRTLVTAGEVGAAFEGASRPGHFDGVLTVVAKLLNIVQPDLATFGQKDAQQLFLVQRMVRDLDLPARIEVIQTVREPDGLALSSRNRYLGEADRAAAVALSRALAAAAGAPAASAAAALPTASDAAATGRSASVALAAALPAASTAAGAPTASPAFAAAVPTASAALAAALAVLEAEDRVETDYVALVDPATFAPVDDGFRGQARALVAARVGGTRLLDNAEVRLG